MQMHPSHYFVSAQAHGVGPVVRRGVATAGGATGASGHESKSCAHAGCSPLLSISNADMVFVPSGARVLAPICSWSVVRIAFIRSGAIFSLHTSYRPTRAGNWGKVRDFSGPAVITTVLLPAASWSNSRTNINLARSFVSQNNRHSIVRKPPSSFFAAAVL